VELTDLPALNAVLNAAATACLTTGWLLIRRRRWRAHRNAMLAALACSAAFLTSYLVYHAQVGSVPYRGSGWPRTLYLVILATHASLAAAVPFLAVVTAFRGLRGRYQRHVAVARWTLPIWLYVSVTGVVVYLMLYHLPGS